MEALAALIPLMPALAAVLIGLRWTLEPVLGKTGEGFTGTVSIWSVSMSCLLALTLACADFMGKNTGGFVVGIWLTSENFQPEMSFISTGFSVWLTALFALLLLIIVRFANNYMHKETGFLRFFFIFSLFSSAMFLITLSGNALGTFFGWEVAGICSFWLIAYAYDRSTAAKNAVVVLVVNRIGDAAFILGIGLAWTWLESMDWAIINTAPEQLDKGQTVVLALCFVIAALAKSALLPFSPWLTKALEGPTPSSAAFYGTVMIHSGIYLLTLLEPLISATTAAITVLILVGATTAFYGYISGLTQTDVKSSYAFAKFGQLGLMALECGLGFWDLARWHLCAHAVVRCYLVLTAPSFMHNVKDVPVKTVSFKPFQSGRLFLLSLQRFWLDQINDWALVRPLRRLARDLSYFDDIFIAKIMDVPVPAMHAASKFAQAEENLIAPSVVHNRPAAGAGLIGKVMDWVGGLVHWFEDRLVLEGIAKDTLHAGRSLGHLANKFETLVLRPRYLVLFVFITFLVAF